MAHQLLAGVVAVPRNLPVVVAPRRRAVVDVVQRRRKGVAVRWNLVLVVVGAALREVKPQPILVEPLQQQQQEVAVVPRKKVAVVVQRKKAVVVVVPRKKALVVASRNVARNAREVNARTVVKHVVV